MKNKEPKNTGPPAEKPSSKGLFKSKKETPNQAAKRFESTLPEVAKRHNIRVSSPYGYYPEDVDKVITEMENENKMLQKENTHLTKQLEDYKGKADALQTEMVALKMQMSLMDVPDASAEESFVMLSRIGTITGNNEEQVQNKIVKTPKPNNITIIKSPKAKTESADTEKPKKGPAVISLNINNKKE